MTATPEDEGVKPLLIVEVQPCQLNPWLADVAVQVRHRRRQDDCVLKRGAIRRQHRVCRQSGRETRVEGGTTRREFDIVVAPGGPVTGRDCLVSAVDEDLDGEDGCSRDHQPNDEDRRLVRSPQRLSERQAPEKRSLDDHEDERAVHGGEHPDQHGEECAHRATACSDWGSGLSMRPSRMRMVR